MTTHSRWFDRVALAAILGNTLVLTLSWLDHTHEVAFDRIDTCFLMFFLLEFVARLRHDGWRWLRQPWNLVDAGIILVALLPVVGDGIMVLRLARLARVLHLGRHFGHLRIAALLRRIGVLTASRHAGTLQARKEVIQ